VFSASYTDHNTAVAEYLQRLRAKRSEAAAQ